MTNITDSVKRGSVNERTKAMMQAVRESVDKTKAGRDAARSKLEAQKPHMALRDTWYELVHLAHGKVPGTKWSAAVELKLAKTFLTETTLEEALTDIRYFFNEWCRAKSVFPSFKLFWSVRGQVRAEVTGALKPSTKRATKEDRMSGGEYNAEEAKKYPRVG